jgi:hypothetical protein
MAEETGGSSGGEGLESTGAVAPDFNQEIREIWQFHCVAACHEGVAGANATLDLRDGDAAAAMVDVPSTQAPDIDFIEPGSPADSYLWLKLTGTHGAEGGQMPLLADPLPAETLQTIEVWISSL